VTVGRVLAALCCVGSLLFGVLAVAVLLFQLACAMAGVPRPTFFRAAFVIGCTFVVWSFVEAALVGIVQAVYRDLNYPMWESGLVTFFLSLPIDLVISSVVHAKLLRMRFGKAVEVWFAHRLILLTIVMAAAGVAAVAVLASNK
jgi:hypothetical protein